MFIPDGRRSHQSVHSSDEQQEHNDEDIGVEHFNHVVQKMVPHQLPSKVKHFYKVKTKLLETFYISIFSFFVFLFLGAAELENFFVQGRSARVGAKHDGRLGL